jgi:hypothetical protein
MSSGVYILLAVFEHFLTPADSKGDSGTTAAAEWRGYRKPILIAGGVGSQTEACAQGEEICP